MKRPGTILAAVVALAGLARAQESAPVTIDTSSSATQLLRRAEDIAAENPGEAARLVQEAADRFAGKLVPWPPETDRYRSAAAAAEDLLRANPAVLDRWLKREAPVAERAVAEGAWIETVRARGATPAALVAMQRLAQRAMDEGRAFEARLWIERALRHPSLDEATRARLEAARATLQEKPPMRLPASTAARAVAEWQPLWSEENPTSWVARRRAEQEPGVLPRGLDEQLEDGLGLAAQPRFEGDAVLLADGATVAAFDRFSGSPLWRTVVGALADRPAQSLCDLTVAVPAGDLVFTLPGHALPDQRSGMPRVVALDRASGQRRWDSSFDAFGRDEFEDLFPHGEPLPVGDLVVVQARKSNSRLESAAWVLALEARSGRLRWALPIGAAGGVRLAASRPLGSPCAVGDDVFVATSLGVVARLDGATGETRWLRRWPAPIREPRAASPAWQLPSPVADDRLVAWLAPDAATLVGLDPADGRTQWELRVGVDTPVGAVRTLLLGAEHLYAIGDDVVALDRADPRKVAWRLQERLPDRAGPIRGGVSLGTLSDGSAALVVPLADQVLVLAPSDGRIVGLWKGRGGANTALDSGQLALCDARNLSLLMPADDGEGVLRARLAEAPDDPRRGLALVELGRSWKRPQLVVDGAIAAAAALQRNAGDSARDLREEIVLRLLEPDTLSAVTSAEADRLVELARSIAVSPAQQARVLLAGAERAAGEGRAPEAVRALRAVAADPSLAQALVTVEPGRQVAAGALARGMLARMSDTEAQAAERALRVSATTPDLPRVGALRGDARWLSGSLVPVEASALVARPIDAVLLHERNGLTMRRAPALEPAWSLPIELRDCIVLAWTPRLVVWSPTEASDAVLLSIDPSDGRPAARIDSVAKLLGAREAAAGEPREERFMLSRLEAGVADGRIIVTRGDGRVTALDDSGAQAWSVQAPLRRMDARDLRAGVLAMIGPAGADEADPVVVLLATNDGAVTHRVAWPRPLGAPRWVSLVPRGVALGGAEGVAVLDLAPGLPVRWMTLDSRAGALEPDQALGGRLLLSDARAQRRRSAISLLDGTFFPDALQLTDPAGPGSVHAVRALPQGWLVHRLGGLTLHDEQGDLKGSAFSATGRRHDEVALASDGVFSIELVQQDLARPSADGRIYSIRRHLPGEGLRSADQPIVFEVDGLRLTGVETLPGWLLLGGEERTLAIPGKSSAPEPR